MILSSFQETSADPLTNTLNAVVVFCLHSGYFLLFCGISLTVAGGLISSSAHKRQKAVTADVPDETAPKKKPADSDVPKPAYYPGGLAPPLANLVPEHEEEEQQIVGTMSNQKPAPISGGVEPALVSDESDAQKLMRNDEQLQSQAKHEQPPAPDYSQYLSNSEPAKPAEAAAAQTSEKSYKPKIVSTMGKNRG
ncbi:MAG: hypothetical protein JW811_09025 [Clostridiales bacterium]|nr:hypothetical protein [Clostridiales bacterium]